MKNWIRMIVALAFLTCSVPALAYFPKPMELRMCTSETYIPGWGTYCLGLSMNTFDEDDFYYDGYNWYTQSYEYTIINEFGLNGVDSVGVTFDADPTDGWYLKSARVWNPATYRWMNVNDSTDSDQSDGDLGFYETSSVTEYNYEADEWVLKAEFRKYTSATNYITRYIRISMDE